MIYTIEDSKGRLILIDGGWETDAELLKEIIRSREIEAWILTHPHPDHIGAFNKIYESGDYKISKIYANPMDYDEYSKRAEERDDFPVYEHFLAITKGADIQYLSEGDILEILGLKFEIFSAFDLDKIKEAQAKDLANDGSLMFKVSSTNSSMLFCSDVGREMSNNIMVKYATKLKSDYIQMGHHGNGGLSEDFYKLVQPKAAFFDAPEWLVEGKRFNTKSKMRFMSSLGSEILSYETSPNSVVLE